MTLMMSPKICNLWLVTSHIDSTSSSSIAHLSCRRGSYSLVTLKLASIWLRLVTLLTAGWACSTSKCTASGTWNGFEAPLGCSRKANRWSPLSGTYDRVAGSLSVELSRRDFTKRESMIYGYSLADAFMWGFYS
jgi:hypothetical protein